MYEEKIVAQLFDPETEFVPCVVCGARIARHMAFRVQIDRWVPAVANTEYHMWVPGPREDGWSETFTYHYTDMACIANVAGPHFFNEAMCYRYTYIGYGCLRSHAEIALEARPWNNNEG